MAFVSLTNIPFNSNAESSQINTIITELENFLGGVTAGSDITILDTFTAGTITDGTASLTSGAYTGLTNITMSGTLDLGTNTILDGNFNGNWAFNSGNLTGIGSLTATTLTDGTASLSGGNLSGVGTLTATTVTDGTATLTGGGLSGATITSSNLLGNDWSAITTATITPDFSTMEGRNITIAAGSIDLTASLQEGDKIEITQSAGSSDTHSLDLEASSSQYAYITDAAQTGLDITGDLTIEAWIKLEQLPTTAGTSMYIASKYESAGNQRAYLFYIKSSTNELNFVYSGDGTAVNIIKCPRPMYASDVGKWVHVAVKADVSTKVAYFNINGVLYDGALESDGGQTSIFNSTTGFAIGSGTLAAPASFFDGAVKNVRIWSDVRTTEEINTYMCTNTGLTVGVDNLVDIWTLNNDYTSESGNNDLTASGSPVFATDVPAQMTATKVYAYICDDLTFSTNTTIPLLTRGDTYLNGSAITAIRFSRAANPFGFQRESSYWDELGVITWDITDPSPSGGVEYQWSAIKAPIGSFNIGSSQYLYSTQGGGVYSIQIAGGISTSSTGWSDNELVSRGYLDAVSGGTGGEAFGATLTSEKKVSLSAQTLYYFQGANDSVTNGLACLSSVCSAKLWAKCAYN